MEKITISYTKALFLNSIEVQEKINEIENIFVETNTILLKEEKSPFFDVIDVVKQEFRVTLKEVEVTAVLMDIDKIMAFAFIFPEEKFKVNTNRGMDFSNRRQVKFFNS